MPFIKVDVDITEIFVAAPVALGFLRVVGKVELSVQFLFSEQSNELGEFLVLITRGDDEVVFVAGSGHSVLSLVDNERVDTLYNIILYSRGEGFELFAVFFVAGVVGSDFGPESFGMVEVV